MSTKAKILALLKAHAGRTATRDQIRGAAGSSEWGRRIRELRQEGWHIQSVRGGYVLKSLKRGKAKDTTPISKRLRYLVLNRDNSKCQRCGRTPADGIRLVIDHKIPREWGGTTTEDNLWVLCEPCNQGKKDHQSDQDAGAMKRILRLKSGKRRVLEYFKIKVKQIVTAAEIRGVAGIHEHARRIRELRAEGWDIVSFHQDERLKPGDYVMRSMHRRR